MLLTDAGSTTTGAVPAGTWTDEVTTELTVATGGSVELTVRLWRPIVLSSPDKEIDPKCAVGDLPAAGTSFQRVSITMRSLEARPIDFPKILMGVISTGPTFNSLLEGEARGVQSTASCAPIGLEELAGAPASVGLGETQLGAAGSAVIDFVMQVASSAQPDLQLGFLFTVNDNETSRRSFVTRTMSPGSHVVVISALGGTQIELETTTVERGQSYTEQVCSALRKLGPPAEEGNDLYLRTIVGMSNIPDTTLGELARAVYDYYWSNRSSTRVPISYSLALERCSELGV